MVFGLRFAAAGLTNRPVIAERATFLVCGIFSSLPSREGPHLRGPSLDGWSYAAMTSMFAVGALTRIHAMLLSRAVADE